MFAMLISIVVVFDVTGAVLLRIWIENSRPPVLLAGILAFAIAALAFAYSMRYEGLAAANAIWIGASVVLVSLLGITVFGEELSFRQLIGIVLVVIGIFAVGI